MNEFRGKRVDNGEWVYGSLIEANDGVFILETGNYDVLFIEPDYHSQGMGCGLEDRNISDRYDAMLHGWEKAMFRVEESYPDFIEVHPDSVGQYTGLKDKNGVEKWHGDIKNVLVITPEYDTPLEGEPEIDNGRFQCDTKITAKITAIDFVPEIASAEMDRVVGFVMSPEYVYELFNLPSTIDKEEFCECILNPIQEAGFDVHTIEDIIACMTKGEVIGNIHENPELLEKP